MPKVTGGLLDEPYPIKTRGDLSRSRVLPLPRASDIGRPATKKAVPAAPAVESEQPQGGFDYIRKRNRLMKKIAGRVSPRSAGRRA